MSAYYEAPSDEAFKEIQDVAARIWQNPQYDYHPSYVSEKVDHIQGLANIKDNYAHIIGMFDDEKQVVLIGLLSDRTRRELFPADKDKQRGVTFERLRPRALW